MRPKTKLFSVKFRRMLEVFGLQVLQKKVWALFSIYASKNKAVSREVQKHFRSFRPASFAEKVLGAISRYMCPKTKLFDVKFRSIFEVLHLRGSQNKFWAHIYDLCVLKRSCLPWYSDAFSKFSACKVQRISSGRIFTIYVSNNEAVCREVQTHFRSSSLARFTE